MIIDSTLSKKFKQSQTIISINIKSKEMDIY